MKPDTDPTGNAESRVGDVTPAGTEPGALLAESLAPFLNLDHLTERVALAMAAAEGNREAQERAHLNNYDALGYTALANAAVAEVRRLGALAWPATADTATGAAGKP